VVRSPEALHLHHALHEIDGVGAVGETNEALQFTDSCVTEPVLITTNGTILAGFGRWRAAALAGSLELNCIEFQLSEDQSLQFILAHHQTRCGWNAFVRIRLALTLEPNLQQKALDNMRTGGKLKGLANLPEAQRIDVRKEIARAAGVGGRNVSNVRTILQSAHPTLIGALKEGTLTINRAIQFCRLSRAAQLEQFIRYSEERATNRVIRRFVPQLKEKEASVDVLAVLEALQCQESRKPGSIAVRFGRHRHTVVLVGQDYTAGPHSRKELTLT
jgi:hypothetical protein